MRTRPTHKPRLDDLDPELVAREAAQRVLDSLHNHVARFALCFPADRIELPDLGEVMRSVLCSKVKALTEFAQTGACSAGLDSTRALEELAEVCVPLYGRPSDPGSIALKNIVSGGFDVDTSIDVVLVATYARARLYLGEAVSARQLACLAGVHPAHVRLLMRRKTLASRADARIAASNAIAWLSERDVRGFPDRAIDPSASHPRQQRRPGGRKRVPHA